MVRLEDGPGGPEVGNGKEEEEVDKEEDALSQSWADPSSSLLASLTSHLTSSQSSHPHQGHNRKLFRLTFNF